MTLIKDIENCIKGLETQKEKLKNGILASNEKKYFKILHKYLEYMGKLIAEEIYEIDKKNESGKESILPRLNILNLGINLWHKYEIEVQKPEILLEERKVSKKNLDELNNMKIKIEVAVQEYPHLDPKTLQNQMKIFLNGPSGMKKFIAKILINIETL